MANAAAELARRKARVEEGTGSRDNKECLQSGSLFCDPTFPADWNSLGYNQLGRYSSKTIGTEWKRPTELSSDPQFIVDGAKRTDICQGVLGDCWLLAAIASLTLDPQILSRVVPPGQNFGSQYAGIFHFQLWQYGQWVDVVVDDRLPSRDGKLLFVHSEEGGEFLEVNSSYEALSGGSSIEGFEDFTGGISESYDLKKAPPFLFNIVRKALKLGSLLGCSIDISSSYETEAITGQKLVKGHAYSVTCTQQVMHSGKSLIRNPWGQVEWTGAWSDNSNDWAGVESEEKKKLDHSADDGEFWMSYTDFLRQFSRLDICNLTPDTLTSDAVGLWSFSEFEGVWRVGSTAGGCRNYEATFCSNSQFFMRLDDEDEEPHDGEPGCSVLIGLMQRDSRRERRFGRELNTIGFSIYQFKGRSDVHLGPDVLLRRTAVARSQNFINQREVCDRFKLPPGEYIIVPSTFEPHHKGSFILRVFTEKQAHTRSVTCVYICMYVYIYIHFNLDCLFHSRILKGFRQTDRQADGQTDRSMLCSGSLTGLQMDGNGKLGLLEFHLLWQKIQKYLVRWNQDGRHSFDVTIHYIVFLRRVAGLRFQVNSSVIHQIVSRFSDQSFSINFDCFLGCLIRLELLFSESLPVWSFCSVSLFLSGASVQ
uniref:Calpain 8 n=1 Tax=Cyclopterus lumpus TaxID=8103 RepID=A0A8C2Z7C8_CYCLU